MNVKKYSKYLVVFAIFLCVMFTFIFFLNLYPLKYKRIIQAYATKYSIQPEIIASIINTESGFNNFVVSDKGAVGLMQLLPETASWLAEKQGISYNYEMLQESDFNIHIGTYYLSYLINKFNCLDTAITAYNAGEGNVVKWLQNKEYSCDGKILKKIPFKESKSYLKKVKNSVGIYKLRFVW